MDRTKICNGKLITPTEIIRNACILLENGKISEISDKVIDADNCNIINANGKYISPGFIDIHTHGAGGCDFMDATVESYISASICHAMHGTTALVPTTVASSKEELKDSLDIFEEALGYNTDGAILLGMHIEGPYFSIKQKGAQDIKYIRNPDINEYSEICSYSDKIIRWSAAPELRGANEFARYITKKGILPSIGHSDAIYSEVKEGYENGFKHVTHLYSGMSTVKRINSYRFAGVIESAYLIDDMSVEIIADGCHLPPSLLKLIYKIKGPDKIALVTDSMRGAGMPEGESILGSKKNGQRVIIEDKVAKTLDRKCFAGSVATTDRLVRTMKNSTDISLVDIIKMMTLTPAKIIGISDKKGSLEVGKDADVVIFDDEISVYSTIINGKITKNELV